MKRFEEEFDKNVDVVEIQLYESETVIKSCNPNQVKALGHGWVSPEDHQAEIEQLKFQLEIPEITKKQAEILNDYKNGSGSLAKYLTTEIKKRDYDYFARAWLNGYTVKEKRFYLKHIDFCKRDKDYDWYMIKHSDGPLNHLRVEKETLPPTVDTYFTQQEIDSMAAESYEQIEVKE